MIVTRFAPSPTGYLHIGGARTALFCWLLARKHQGKFILRIEDTDQKRNTPTATQQVMDDLRWLGIDWDEGPDKDGENGPYFQSQRLDIYNKYLQKLLDEGKAYYCFDTQEELQVLREKAQAEKKTFIYPRPETFPTEQEVQAARDAGKPVVVRFCMPEESITVSDVVRGEVVFDAKEFSDIIIQKSDGFPTYHFACVVDDELMGITHIIRGQEHLMNTPGHMALQRALDFKTPTYAHISVTVSEGGGKLSKRERGKVLQKAIKAQENIDLTALANAGNITLEELQSFIDNKTAPDGPNITAMAKHLEMQLPEINVIDFFDSGYLPEAMINFVALLGWNPGDDREIMPLDELTEAFTLERLSKTNSLFDRKKLVSFNTEHFKTIDPEKRLGHFKDYLQTKDSPLAQLDDETLKRLLLINEGAQTFGQVVDKCMFLCKDEYDYDPKAVNKVLNKEGAPELLDKTKEALSNLEEWKAEPIHKLIKELSETHEVGMGKIAQPIRVSITGTMVSPSIQDSLELLGKQKTLNRISNTLEYLKTI